MAFPLSQGSTPESGIVPADQWTKVADAVSLAKITNLYSAGPIVWVTYGKISETEPTTLDLPKWKIPTNYAQFRNGTGISHIYVYPVDREVLIEVQT